MPRHQAPRIFVSNGRARVAKGAESTMFGKSTFRVTVNDMKLEIAHFCSNIFFIIICAIFDVALSGAAVDSVAFYDQSADFLEHLAPLSFRCTTVLRMAYQSSLNQSTNVVEDVHVQQLRDAVFEWGVDVVIGENIDSLAITNNEDDYALTDYDSDVSSDSDLARSGSRLSLVSPPPGLCTVSLPTRQLQIDVKESDTASLTSSNNVAGLSEASIARLAELMAPTIAATIMRLISPRLAHMEARAGFVYDQEDYVDDD